MKYNIAGHREPPKRGPSAFSDPPPGGDAVTGLCTPGMGVSVGVQVPCRRFTFMSRKIPEDNYQSKARASPRGEV